MTHMDNGFRRGSRLPARTHHRVTARGLEACLRVLGRLWAVARPGLMCRFGTDGNREQGRWHPTRPAPGEGSATTGGQSGVFSNDRFLDIVVIAAVTHTPPFSR